MYTSETQLGPHMHAGQLQWYIVFFTHRLRRMGMFANYIKWNMLGVHPANVSKGSKYKYLIIRT
jgi:hypothetical protein